jgi:hypothetical protein
MDAHFADRRGASLWLRWAIERSLAREKIRPRTDMRATHKSARRGKPLIGGGAQPKAGSEQQRSDAAQQNIRRESEHEF